jgi:hypothetical protein
MAKVIYPTDEDCQIYLPEYVTTDCKTGVTMTAKAADPEGMHQAQRHVVEVEIH